VATPLPEFRVTGGVAPGDFARHMVEATVIQRVEMEQIHDGGSCRPLDLEAGVARGVFVLRPNHVAEFFVADKPTTERAGSKSMPKDALELPAAVIQQLLVLEDESKVGGLLRRVRAIDRVDGEPSQNAPTEEVDRLVGVFGANNPWGTPSVNFLRAPRLGKRRT
jgi:hypothetical protein